MLFNISSPPASQRANTSWARRSSKINCFSMDIQNAFNSESTPFVPMDMRSSPFMGGSWEVYEWLMGKQWVATATQRIILNLLTTFKYQLICHVCLHANTFTHNSYFFAMDSLERRTSMNTVPKSLNIRFMSEVTKYHSRRSTWQHLWVAAVSCKTFLRGPVDFLFMSGSSAGDPGQYSWGAATR